MLAPVGAVHLQGGIGIRNGIIAGGATIGFSRWCPEKNEVEFLRAGSATKLDYDLDVSFDVVFGDTKAFSGQPVVATLRSLHATISNINTKIESAALK